MALSSPAASLQQAIVAGRSWIDACENVELRFLPILRVGVEKREHVAHYRSLSLPNAKTTTRTGT